jgi:hypothetical protein
MTEVFTEVKMNIMVLWVMKPCSPIGGYPRFAGTWQKPTDTFKIIEQVYGEEVMLKSSFFRMVQTVFRRKGRSWIWEPTWTSHIRIGWKSCKGENSDSERSTSLVHWQYALPSQTVNQLFHLQVLEGLRQRIRRVYRDNAPLHTAHPVRENLAVGGFDCGPGTPLLVTRSRSVRLFRLSYYTELSQSITSKI